MRIPLLTLALSVILLLFRVPSCAGQTFTYTISSVSIDQASQPVAVNDILNVKWLVNGDAGYDRCYVAVRPFNAQQINGAVYTGMYNVSYDNTVIERRTDSNNPPQNVSCYSGAISLKIPPKGSPYIVDNRISLNQAFVVRINSANQFNSQTSAFT